MFEDVNVMHVDGSVDPTRDIETINFELVFSDLELVERRILRVSKTARTDRAAQRELDILNEIKKTLDEGLSAKSVKFPADDEALVSSLNLLTRKPVLYALNVSEEDVAGDGADNPKIRELREFADSDGSEMFAVCAKMEEELLSLDDAEQLMFLNDLGVTESGLSKLIRASYRSLGLISFLTAGPKETRAWTIVNGTKAPQAAGKIHSDIERGFIRAEIVNCEDLLRLGSYSLAKDNGLVRLEGKEYVVKESDVILFRFNI